MPTAAIWGGGSIAHTHAEVLRGNGIPIGAVVDIHRDRAVRLGEQWGIPVCSDDAGVLFAPGIDCVHICTPPGLHGEMAAALLREGKHLLCEKPLCLDGGEARRLAALARERGRVCGVNFNVRFHEACRQARVMAAAESFGRVLLVHGSYLQEFHALPAPMDWRYSEKLAGPMRAVTEIGSHWMDLAEYVSGRRIEAVSALFGRFFPRRYLEDGQMHAEPGTDREPVTVASEDAAVFSLRFEGGAIGAVTLSEVSQGRTNRLALEVTGENKNLWWDSESANRLHYAEKGGEVRSRTLAFGGGFADTFRELVAALYRDVAAGQPSARPGYPTLWEGARSVLLCDAVLRSAENDGAWTAVEDLE